MQCCWKNYIVGYYIEYMFDISQITDLLVCYFNLISLMRQYFQEKKLNVYETIAIPVTITYESVRYIFNLKILCYYNNYPCIHSNANFKHLSNWGLHYALN